MAQHFKLTDYAYAHRGLWSAAGPVENTLTAFTAASAAGFGIELDVRPDRDGDVVVFHDQDLKRLTGRAETIESLTIKDLKKARLHEGETIPTFRELLDIWPRELPLLTELKIDGRTDTKSFARKIGHMLEQYDGPAAAMSFFEDAVRALPSALMRGQLLPPSAAFSQDAFSDTIDRTLNNGIDYLAVHASDIATVRNHLPSDYPVVAWTITSEAQLRDAYTTNVAIIFEHLDTALVTRHLLP